jgi:hypothetical protein
LTAAVRTSDQAFALYQDGRYAAAQRLYEQALHWRRQFLGENHPHTASSYANVAACLNALGQ